MDILFEKLETNRENFPRLPREICVHIRSYMDWKFCNGCGKEILKTSSNGQIENTEFSYSFENRVTLCCKCKL